MCNICKDYELGKLTWKEAWSHSYELTDSEHMTDVQIMLINEGIEEDETNG